ncbi:MAG: FprA family A-type flavoprotein [Lentimicrobiaceae bacterium]|nr:FprA family A-type flavoprotein [Lentimicrobiaceae bacterium]
MERKSDEKILPVTRDVQWIGVLDYDIVTFDVVMETKFGTTYNSYFIDAENKTIIETSKEKFWPVWKEKILKVTKPEEIRYIVLNHTEPDHSGNLAHLLELAPHAEVVGSGVAIRYLKDLLGREFPNRIVKDGDRLDLGNKTLQFIGAPNLHWPDSMYTWLVEDKVLFTCDSFGAHFCHDAMYDDEVGNYDEAFKYYFDVILKPFSKFMLKAIEKIRDLPIEVICTGHGPILRSDWRRYVDQSEAWAREFVRYPELKRVFIPYVSAYQKTTQIAESIASGVRSVAGVEAVPMDIEHASLGELEEQVTRAAGIIVGSPTINQNILLPVYKLFAIMTPLRDRGKLSGGFGSYGWSGESQKLIRSALENLKTEYVGEGIFVKFTPTENALSEAEEYGRQFATKLLSQES